MPAVLTVDTGHISYSLVATDVNTDNRETSQYNTGKQTGIVTPGKRRKHIITILRDLGDLHRIWIAPGIL